MTKEPVVDPAEAHRAAVDAGLVVLREHPLNCETPVRALIGGAVMPSARFYVRNHFDIPMLDDATWRLAVTGLVERPLSLTLHDLHRMASQTLAVTLECAGNGRSRLNPAVDGEQWELGAVSTAEWTGVPLREVLDRARIGPQARELVFRGADEGTVAGRPNAIRFERSLAIEDASGADALLAYTMNGEPLPPVHGYPVRLVVPRFYGVASVKWLAQIEAAADPFEGFFQKDRYQYEWDRDGRVLREPVELQRVRALITEPQPGEHVDSGDVAVRGLAWSGAAPIARVEVSIAGAGWREARLIGEPTGTSWQRWELITPVTSRGRTSIRARATDMAGRSQPESPEWNRLGYGSNAVQEMHVSLR